MTTEETDVKNYLRKELEYLAEVCGFPIGVMQNPANMQSQQGRADCDVIVNNVLYIHVEVKREGEDLSPAQQVLLHEGKYGFINTCVAGRSGVDTFIASLPGCLAQLYPAIMAGSLNTIKTLHERIDIYTQGREKRASAAARRPVRQSKKISGTLH